MKKLITMAALAFAGAAFAGDYHYGEELKCAQCHTMHATRAHGFEVLGGAADKTGIYGTPTSYNAGDGFNKLLVGGTTNDACLACHNRGGTSGYDVFGAGGSTNGVRSAGALNIADAATGITAVAPGVSSTLGGQESFTYLQGMGHSLGATTAAPGGTFANPAGFDCGDCHEVHGNAAFRNLGPQYSGIVTFTVDQQPTYTIDAAATTANPLFDVTETGAAEYNTAGVFFGYGNGANRMNAYCAGCHGNFHGDTNVAGTGGAFRRHPTGTATSTYDFAVGGRYTAKDIVRPVYAAGGNISPGCLSCHKAHGNARAFALVYPGDVTNVNLEEGDEGYVKDHRNNYFWNPRVLCNTCHYQGKH